MGNDSNTPTNITRKELLKLSKTQLIKECKKHNVSSIGSKSDMIDRLLCKMQMSKARLKKSSTKSKSKSSTKKPSSSSQVLYIIGKNDSGELGVNHVKNMTKLEKFKNLKFDYYSDRYYNNYYGNFSQFYNTSITATNIHPGNRHTIYSNLDTIETSQQQLWGTGFGGYGQLGFGQNSVTLCREIKYFKDNNIRLSKICTNVNSDSTFWITDKYKVYAAGRNDKNQLGMESYSGDHYDNAPKLIESLSNIIDIQATEDWSIALCGEADKKAILIIYNWARKAVKNNWIMPKDIMLLIISFHGENKVYTTSNKKGKCKWNEIKLFATKNISKIAAGSEHAMFLETNGKLWWTLDGRNCERMDVFIKMRVRVKDVCCGRDHNLIIDENYNVWSWGYNYYGQCGNGTTKDIGEPEIIDALKDERIKEIQCGYVHSYCRTFNDENYMFGNNGYSECIQFENVDNEKVILPFCIDDNIDEYCDGKVVKKIFLGNCNTKIIVGPKGDVNGNEKEPVKDSAVQPSFA